MTLGIILGIELTPARESAAILIMAASIRAGQSWDLRLPYASLRVTLRVGTQKQPTFMHLLTGLRLQHPPKRQQFSFWGSCRINAAFRQVWERRIYAAARRQSENSRSESQNENCWRPWLRSVQTTPSQVVSELAWAGMLKRTCWRAAAGAKRRPGTNCSICITPRRRGSFSNSGTS